MIRNGHATTGQPACQIDPVVHRERRVAEANLRCPSGVESRQHHSPQVGDAITGRVFQIQQIGRGTDEHAAVPWHDAVRKGEIAGKVRSLVEASIAVGILEQGNDALRSRRSRAFQRTWISATLNDIHPAAVVERDRNRGFDQRLRRGQFDSVTRLQLKTG